MIRIAIADDHPLVRDALRDLVQAQTDMVVVAAVGDGESVLPALAATPCDILVLDLSLPGATGFSVLAQVREHAPDVAVLVYTMYPEALVQRAALAAGAAGWLCKRRSPQAVLTALREIASGIHQPAVGASETGAPHETLTPRQQELFLLICEGASPGDLVRRLDLSPSTVSSHLTAIRDKLGVETNGEILVYAVNAGLLG